MDDRPFAIFSDPDGNRVHNAAAVRGPVAGFHIHVETAETVGAVVAMVAPRSGGDDRPAADLAGEAVVAGVGFVISLFELLSFVFPIHGEILLKSVIKTFWEVCLCVVCANLPVYTAITINCLFIIKEISFE